MVKGKEIRLRLRMIIKTFLVVNRGKEYTSKQITSFINNHKFGLRTGIESSTVTRLIKNDIQKGGSVLSEVEMIKKRNKWYFTIR